MFYLYPVFVAIGARFTLKERSPLEKPTALLIAVFGCSLIFGVWENSISISAAGIFFALSSTSGCAAYTLLVKVAVREHPPERVLAYSLAFALPFLLLVTSLASRASITATVEPVLASLLAYATLGEQLSALQILGMSLILVGAVLVQWERG